SMAAAPEATPDATLTGPLARSLLARRLMARKAAESDGASSTDPRARRPLRVR
ncbi:MAG: hypothetical protein JWP02_2452, partial [Acidimicrobiales bacterium]|nr:hypothetical protein [Acidimicrobiales bacterium]